MRTRACSLSIEAGRDVGEPEAVGTSGGGTGTLTSGGRAGYAGGAGAGWLTEAGGKGSDGTGGCGRSISTSARLLTLRDAGRGHTAVGPLLELDEIVGDGFTAGGAKGAESIAVSLGTSG